MTHKTCTVCKRTLLLTDFYKETRNRNDGHLWECKQCSSARNKRFYEANKEKVKATHQAYTKANRDKLRTYHNKWSKENKEKRASSTKRYNNKLRIEFLKAYGHKCECCGESHQRFLTLEHKLRDGSEHRKRTPAGPRMLNELKRLGWPKDNYGLLCWNCNLATRFGDPCPHTIDVQI